MDLATFVLVVLGNFVARLRPPNYSRYADDLAYSKWQRANALWEYEMHYEPLQAFAAKTVLDLGCGDGGKTMYYASKQPKLIVGIDIDAAKICSAKRFSDFMRAESDCCFLLGNAENCPFLPSSFDTILSEDCFEHYPNPEAVLKEAHRLLRPGGLFVIRFATYYNLDGPHLLNFIRLPWAHLLFSDETLIKVTRIIAKQLAQRYSEEHRRETFEAQAEREIYQFQHYVNKITLVKWRKLIKGQKGWKIVVANTQCNRVKLPLFKLPILEELHSSIFVVLQKI